MHNYTSTNTQIQIHNYTNTKLCVGVQTLAYCFFPPFFETPPKHRSEEVGHCLNTLLHKQTKDINTITQIQIHKDKYKFTNVVSVHKCLRGPQPLISTKLCFTNLGSSHQAKLPSDNHTLNCNHCTVTVRTHLSKSRKCDLALL